jgi:hypothetical protein
VLISTSSEIRELQSVDAVSAAENCAQLKGCSNARVTGFVQKMPMANSGYGHEGGNHFVIGRLNERIVQKGSSGG